MRRRWRQIAGVVGVYALLIASGGCATKTANVEDVALAIGELALQVDSAEHAVVKAGLLTGERQRVVSAGVLRLLYASRTFERAVAAKQDHAIQLKELKGVVADLAKTTANLGALSAAVDAVARAIGGL